MRPASSLLLLSASLGLVPFGLAAAPAQAQTTFYADQPTFLANTTGTTTLDFEGIAPDSGDNYYSTPPGLTLSGVNFTINPVVSSGNLFVIGKNSYYPGNSVLASQSSQTAVNDLLITFSSPVTAIGLDFGDNFISPNTAAFTLSDGETFSRPTGSMADFNFVGLTTTTPITTLDIQTANPPSGGSLNIDNFTFGGAAPAAVPEASTTVSFGLLLALGLGGAVAASRKKKAGAAV